MNKNKKVSVDLKKAMILMEEISSSLRHKQKQISNAQLDYKTGKEIVSNYDIQTEKNIRKKLKKILPKYKIWGEELGRDSGNLEQENFIVIDPIDGTKNFLSGVPLYASQIAAIKKGKIEWGIISLPALNETFWAQRGVGAFLNENKISPSKQNNINLAMQCFGIGHDAENFIKLPKIIRKTLAEPRHYGCAGVHYSFLASGRIDIYIATEAKYYDMAPGLLLCKEAGLSFCNLKGEKFNFNENDTSVVIGNSSLIKQYKNIVKS